MNLVKAFPKITLKRFIGMKRLQIKDLQQPKTIWLICIKKVRGASKIMRKQSLYLRNLLNNKMSMHN